jgi:hypothetical protein
MLRVLAFALEAAILLLAIWHLKVAFLIQSSLLLLLISPLFKTIEFFSEVDLRLLYLEGRGGHAWWWKKDPNLRSAMERILLDELEGRTKAGVPVGQSYGGDEEEDIEDD